VVVVIFLKSKKHGFSAFASVVRHEHEPPDHEPEVPMNAFTSKEPLFLNDVRVGMAWAGRPVAITADAIIAFAKEYDPQPFHIDPVAAASTSFGGLIASGWQVAALGMRQFVDARPFGSSPIVGLGVNDLRWLKPVRPGDILETRGEIVEVKPSRSKPDRGVVHSAIKVFNQAGEMVMSVVAIAQLPRREERV
jgi:acyl dehydratase